LTFFEIDINETLAESFNFKKSFLMLPAFILLSALLCHSLVPNKKSGQAWQLFGRCLYKGRIGC
jgi:hypothetical protein